MSCDCYESADIIQVKKCLSEARERLARMTRDNVIIFEDIHKSINIIDAILKENTCDIINIKEEPSHIDEVSEKKDYIPSNELPTLKIYRNGARWELFYLTGDKKIILLHHEDKQFIEYMMNYMENNEIIKFYKNQCEEIEGITLVPYSELKYYHMDYDCESECKIEEIYKVDNDAYQVLQDKGWSHESIMKVLK